MMPGNPAVAMMGKFRGKISGQELQALETIFGVKQRPVPARAVRALPGRRLHRQLRHVAVSTSPPRSARVVRTAIFWTLGLVGVTTILAFLLGTGVGILAAWRRGGLTDSLAPPLLVITSADPVLLGRHDVHPDLRP